MRPEKKFLKRVQRYKGGWGQGGSEKIQTRAAYFPHGICLYNFKRILMILLKMAVFLKDPSLIGIIKVTGKKCL